MSEAEKEFTELKEHIEVLCEKVNRSFAETMDNDQTDTPKNKLLKEQNEVINFLKTITDSTINQVIRGIKMAELMTNGGSQDKLVN